MKALISRLTVISALLFPALSSAVVIPGNIHHGRYTFFLTEEGGEMLRDMNDAAVSVKLNNKAGFAVEAQRMAAAANISPLLYAASPLEENFIRYDSKPVKALTCLITSRNMPGTNKNYSWEETYCLDETGAAYIGTQGWPSRTIFDKSCGVGASDCPVYLSLKNDPPTLRNDSAQYVPYSSAYRSETVTAIATTVTIMALPLRWCFLFRKCFTTSAKSQARYARKTRASPSSRPTCW